MDIVPMIKPRGIVQDKLQCTRNSKDRCSRIFSRHVWLVVLLSATLVACGSGSGTDSGTDRNTDGPGASVADLAVGTGEPADAGQDFFVNGVDQDARESHWVCFSPDDIGSSRYWAVAFYADATGRYVGADTQQLINWAYNDPNVSFELSTQAGVYDVSIVERVTAIEFDAMVSLDGTAGEMRKCLRFDERGNRI